MKMKAAILRRTGFPLSIESGIQIPSLKPGQILVKLAYSGVCHSQLMEAQGKRGEDRYLPHLLGHEGSGRVVEVGEGVTKCKSGDRVGVGWIRGSGMEAGGAEFIQEGEVIHAGGVTTFSDYTVVSENRCFSLPADIPLDVGVLFGCAVLTGAGVVVNTLKPLPQTSIAILGLGAIGLSALLATRIYCFSQVIAIDRNPKKLELAKQLGATLLVHAQESNPLAVILENTSGKGVDYCVESAGLIQTIELGFQLVRKHGGLCVFASHPEAGQKIALDPFDLISGKQLQGTWGGACQPDRDIPFFCELYRQGKFPLEKLLDRRYSLDDINLALDDLDRGQVTRPLIEIDPSL